MRLKKVLLFVLTSATVFGLVACEGDQHGDHDHAGHDHDEHAEDHDGDEGHDHDGDDHGHEHDTIIAGPNGGRVITSFEPHAEFFVTESSKVQITFVDDEIKAIAPGSQEVTVIAGDRSNPTILTFTKIGGALVSGQALPDGDDFPVVVMLKADAMSKAVTEKFTLDLTQCPSCDYLEYACTCAH
jgi:hypothetical protein